MDASRLLLNNVDTTVVDTLAATLAESEKRPLEQLRMVVDCLGSEKALQLLAQTEQIEQGGGMLVPDGSRRRTPGGVFFALARKHLSNKDRHRIFGVPPAPQSRATVEEAPPQSSRRPIAPPRRRFVEVSAIPRARPVMAHGEVGPAESDSRPRGPDRSGSAARPSPNVGTGAPASSAPPAQRRRRIVTIADLARPREAEEQTGQPPTTPKGETGSRLSSAERETPSMSFAAEIEARFGGVPKTRVELRRFIRVLLQDRPSRERQRLFLELLLQSMSQRSSGGRPVSLREQLGVLAAYRLGYSVADTAAKVLGDRSRRGRQQVETVLAARLSLSLVEQLMALQEQD